MTSTLSRTRVVVLTLWSIVSPGTDTIVGAIQVPLALAIIVAHLAPVVVTGHLQLTLLPLVVRGALTQVLVV